MKLGTRQVSSEASDVRLLARSSVLLRRFVAASEALRRVSTMAGVAAARDALEEVARESKEFLHG